MGNQTDGFFPSHVRRRGKTSIDVAMVGENDLFQTEVCKLLLKFLREGKFPFTAGNSRVILVGCGPKGYIF
jgi:hypothetical protein